MNKKVDYLSRKDDREARSSRKKQKTAKTEEQEHEQEEVEGEANVDEAEKEADKVKKDGSVEPYANEDGSINVIITDPELLDCPICFEILTTPIFQCKKGHRVCGSCCNKIKKKCPSCSSIGYNRCPDFEKLLESIKVLCKNYSNGCIDPVSYCKQQDHERTCLYAPCFCPIPGCDFVSDSQRLYTHFRCHQAKQFSFNCRFSISLEADCKYAILQERNEDVVFILNNRVSPLGNAVSVNCIAPSSIDMNFAYDLRAKRIAGNTVRMESFTEKIPRWVENHPQKIFLLVPSHFIGSQLKLVTCIRKLS